MDNFLACGTSHGIPVYHMVQMDKWDCLTPDHGGMWDVLWNFSIPQIEIEVLPDGSMCVPMYHIVQNGWDGQVGLPES